MFQIAYYASSHSHILEVTFWKLQLVKCTTVKTCTHSCAGQAQLLEASEGFKACWVLLVVLKGDTGSS
jgi:hypothetical protein